MTHRPGNQKDLATRRAWYAKHKDKIQKRKRELRRSGKYKKQETEYRLKRKAVRAEQVRKDRLANPEKYAVVWNRFYESHKIAMRKRRRDYYYQNIEKSRAAGRNRFANRRYEAGVKHSGEDVLSLLASQKYKCINCLCCLRRNAYHVDHIVPLYLGGSNGYKNLQVLCATCNLKKNKKDPIVWAQQNGRLL